MIVVFEAINAEEKKKSLIVIRSQLWLAVVVYKKDEFRRRQFWVESSGDIIEGATGQLSKLTSVRWTAHKYNFALIWFKWVACEDTINIDRKATVIIVNILFPIVSRKQRQPFSN